MPKRVGKPCRCWSGQPAKECCKDKAGRWRPRQAVTAPPGKTTGFVHPECYSNSDANCSHQLSAEHIIPNSVLELLNVEGGLRVQGAPWAKGEAKLLPPSAHKAKILCKRHNENLSDLDAVHTKFVETIFQFLYAHFEGLNVRLFNGHSIERALLKTLINKIVSEWSAIRGKQVKAWSPSDLLLDYVWGRTQMLPESWGLYYPDREVILTEFPELREETPRRSYFIKPLFDVESDTVLGCLIGIHQIYFLISLVSPGNSGLRRMFRGSIHRPSGLTFNFKYEGFNRHHEIQFAWFENSGTIARLPDVWAKVGNPDRHKAFYGAGLPRNKLRKG